MNFFLQNKRRNNTDKGFTLIELLIATAVFVAIMTVSLGSVVSILDAGRKARSLKSVMTNLNFTIEVMSREIKFGTHYHCTQDGEVVVFPPSPQNCTSTNGLVAQKAISFVTSEDVDVIYKLVGTQIQKSIDGGVTFLGVTSPEIVIQDLRFFVFNSFSQASTDPDEAQPRVTILVRGYAGERPSSQSNFMLQTTVSQRIPDIGGSTGGAGPATTPGMITITADNLFDLYFNGSFVGSADDWQTAHSYSVPVIDGSNIIAVKGTDLGEPASILAEIQTATQTLGTSGSWKYSLSLVPGWEQAGFDDSSWSNADDNGAYGAPGLPWSFSSVSGMPAGTPAHWIWGGTWPSPVYFRYTFTNP